MEPMNTFNHSLSKIIGSTNASPNTFQASASPCCVHPMESPHLISTPIHSEKRPAFGLVLALAFMLLPIGLMANVSLDLGSAAPFAILAGTGITNTGITTIAGDIGSFPTPTITGASSIYLNGTNYGGGLVSQAAKNDLINAYSDAVGRSATNIYGAVFDLAGLTLPGGVYRDPTSFALSGTLTLDAQGDADTVWLFQAGTTLSTGANSLVNLINGAQADNVFWQVGSSATLGADTDFAGNILAYTSITLGHGARIDGGLYAVNGAVTLDTNAINNLTTVPEPSSVLLLVGGLSLLYLQRRRLATKAHLL